MQQGGISIGPQNSLKWDGLSASVIKNYLVSMGWRRSQEFIFAYCYGDCLAKN
jgi:hypothetical protein